MSTHPRRVLIGIIVMALVGVVTVDAARRIAQWPEHLSALSTNMGNFGVVRPGPVDIFVFQWSTRVEQHRLLAAFAADGPEAFLEELMNTPEVGYVRTPDNRIYNVHFAWDEPWNAGGRRIILVTARTLRFWDAATPRSNTYGFTMIEIRLNGDGTGEGKMSLTTKVAVNEEFDLLELADYAHEPARLLFGR
jgi:hypothetical protein